MQSKRFENKFCIIFIKDAKSFMIEQSRIRLVIVFINNFLNKRQKIAKRSFFNLVNYKKVKFSPLYNLKMQQLL